MGASSGLGSQTALWRQARISSEACPRVSFEKDIQDGNGREKHFRNFELFPRNAG